jgi:serine phosphatase RsbU (regulator of sigma subunit)/Tfp pilus assembly protein PilF
MVKKIKILIFFTLLNSFSGLGNSDSLLAIWNNKELEDTTRTDAYQIYIIQYFLYNSPDSAYTLAQGYYKFAKQRRLKYRMSTALNIQGISKYFVNDYKEAIHCYSRCLKHRITSGNQKGIASVLNNIGNVYFDQADYINSLKYFQKSLKIEEKLKNETGIASSLNNIGLIYKEQQDYKLALSYYHRSLEMHIKIDNKMGESHALNNIGVIHMIQKNYNEALNYFHKSLDSNEGYEDNNTAQIKYNIGVIQTDRRNFEVALDNLNEAIKIQEDINDQQGKSNSLNQIAEINFRQNLVLKAISFSRRSLNIAKEIGAKIEMRNAYQSLYRYYNTIDRTKEALDMFTLFIDTRDKIENDSISKEIIRLDIKYEYEKKADKDSINNAYIMEIGQGKIDNEREKKELAEQKNYYLYGGLFLTLIFGSFIYNIFKVTSNQKEIIENQKQTVIGSLLKLEEKNKEILDSINYAKRIQSAILPPDKLIKEYFNDSFILYKPKAIVAGDFYWMEHKNGKTLFAAADCTGHGVPGAMISVICNNGLNRAVRECGLTDPGEILDKTREIVISEFAKSDEDVSDGMDIALCSIEGYKLKYAGAHNPLWIIRNKKIIEIKANKQPIGKYPGNDPYVTHFIELEKEDIIYLSSDGYADQFGGENHKKFKTKEFKTLLLKISHFEMSKQKDILNDSFEKWRGDLEQLDDVCILAVKI